MQFKRNSKKSSSCSSYNTTAKGHKKYQRNRVLAVIATLSITSFIGVPVSSAVAEQANDTKTIMTADNADLHTWWQKDSEKNVTGPIDDAVVRESPYYSTQVMASADLNNSYDSFTYVSIPRNGNQKIGYDETDGAEFASEAGLSMSWSTFEYSSDVQVDISLDTGQTITTADQVTVRPAAANLKKELVGPSTIRVSVPYNSDGYRFSVEFEPQLYTAYDNGGSLTDSASDSASAIHTEPRNSMMIFAQPMPSQDEASASIPTEESGDIYRPKEGLVDNLNDTDAQIIYFEPGTYYMGNSYHALLPSSVKWVYLAPGAYVKGAFKFLEGQVKNYKVTGYGVLSGEQYVYEADTGNDYNHLDPNNSNCHSSCVKMLQFQSIDDPQTLDLQGITVANPPYHSFVVYGNEDTFTMNVRNYQQVGAWYWQTDGIELYSGSTMRNTFFHSNDDVLKMYHSNVDVTNTVVWKNENGPVIQWGWSPRNIDNITVTDTDVIHNRMHWNNNNTCIFNASSHWEGSETNRADTTMTVRNMKFRNTTVEGMTNCAIRVFALQNTENIEIDGLHIDSWNDMAASSQHSLLKAFTNTEGTPVVIGNEMTNQNGLLLHNYTVGTSTILKAGDNWASDELGRLDFDSDQWDNWNATADDEPTGTLPTLDVAGITNEQTASSRTIDISGVTDAATLTISIDNGDEQPIAIEDGRFTTTINLPDIVNYVRIKAISQQGVMNVQRYTLYAFGTNLGTIEDPSGDDNGPGSYVYPSDSAFNPGSFDMTQLNVYQDSDTIRFVTSIASEINNPWGGNGMSTQRLNIYVSQPSNDGSPSSTNTSEIGDDKNTVTPLLPGTNMYSAGSWSRAIVADGRNTDSAYGSGIYDSQGNQIADTELSVIPSGMIIASIPLSSMGGIDPARATYQVSMFSSSEDSESVGNVRPVYSTDCWNGNGCSDTVNKYRFGGGLGIITDESPYDDVTTDANAIDIMSGNTSQADLMNTSRQQIIVPFVSLETPSTDDNDNGGKGEGSELEAGDSTTNEKNSQKTLSATGASITLVSLSVMMLILTAFVAVHVRRQHILKR